MSSSDPPDPPEHHADILSPVSPKPIHAPSPSNIPILENQMDPTLDEPTLNQQQPSLSSDAQQLEAQDASQQLNAALPGTEAPSADSSVAQATTNGNADLAVADAMPDGPSMEHALSNAAPSFADLNSVDLPSVPQSALDNGTLPDAATEPTPAVPDAATVAAPMNLQGMNIQELLDSINASNGAGGPGLGLNALLGGAAVPSATPSDLANILPDQSALAAQAEQASEAVDAVQESPAFPNEPTTAPVDTSQLAGLSAIPSETEAANTLASPAATTEVATPFVTQDDAPTKAAVQPQQPAVAGPTSTPATPSLNPTSHQPHNIDAKDGENVPWEKETQRKYDQFLDEERQYVLEGNWDRFPMGSRLFIGNLSSEKVTKRDLFHVFHRYGKLAQISIKQAYGFVQFLEAGDCGRSLHQEQGVSIRGRKVHLEISKPQKAKGAANNGNNEGRSGRRRSRSPERRANGERGHRGGRGRHQDNYRPPRSPSPRARDSYRSRRSPDRYDGRRRSRSPFSRDVPRYQSSSAQDDGVPLPFRPPQHVPDIQILIKENLERPFIEYVRSTFLQRGLKVDDLVLVPRLNEQSVMRRQIIEGVLAVIRLDFAAQHRQKFHLSVFDRSAGFGNVRFEEYQDMDLNICVELVARAKQNAAQRPASDYAMAQYGLPSAPIAAPSPMPNQSAFGMPPPPPPPTAPPSAITGMDPGALQRLLAGMHNGGSGQQQGVPTMGAMPGGMGYGAQPSPTNAGFGAHFPKPPMPPTIPGYGGQAGAVQQNGGGPGGPPPGAAGGGGEAAGDVNSILQQLMQYRQ